MKNSTLVVTIGAVVYLTYLCFSGSIGTPALLNFFEINTAVDKIMESSATEKNLGPKLDHGAETAAKGAKYGEGVLKAFSGEKK